VSIDGGTAEILFAAATTFVTAPWAVHVVGRAANPAGGIDIRPDGPDDPGDVIDAD
jgi:multisubunit Na+/H+ antiporter MnhG subunit